MSGREKEVLSNVTENDCNIPLLPLLPLHCYYCLNKNYSDNVLVVDIIPKSILARGKTALVAYRKEKLTINALKSF